MKLKKMKLVPMPGLEINYYKGYIIEWIEHLGMYRVYERKYPDWTCCYADSIRDAQESIDDNLSRKTLKG